MMPKWRFRFLRISFGLTPKYIENVYEQFFFLQYSGGWSLTEVYNLPAGLRDWFTNRLIKQLEAERDAAAAAAKGQSTSQTLTRFNQPKKG